MEHHKIKNISEIQKGSCTDCFRYHNCPRMAGINVCYSLIKVFKEDGKVVRQVKLIPDEETELYSEKE